MGNEIRRDGAPVAPVPQPQTGAANAQARPAVVPPPPTQVAQVTPNLPPAPSRQAPINPSLPAPGAPVETQGPSAPATAAPTTTPQSRINELADKVIDRLRAGDNRGALDVVHHQHMPTGDEQFASRLRSAIMVKTGARNIEMVLGNLSTTERAYFDAYIENPRGVALPHNLIYAAVRGAGSNVGNINDVIADLRAHNPTEEGFQRALSEVDAAYVRRYGKERGVTSMDQDLQGSMFSELWGSARKSYRGARTGSEDALTLYNAAEGRWLPTHDGDAMMGVFERNIGNPGRLADDFRYVADGGQQGATGPAKPHFDDPPNTAPQTEGMHRLQGMIDYNMTPSEILRAHALMDKADTVPPDERAVNYLNMTMRDYLAGRVTAPGMVQALRNLMANPDSQKTNDKAPLRTTELTRLDPKLVEQLARAKDPAVAGVVAQLRSNHDFVGGDAAVGEVRQMLSEGRGRLFDLQSRLYAMTDEQRAAVRKAIPDFNQQIDKLARRGNRPIAAQYNAIVNALDGKQTDPGSLLDMLAGGHARAADVVGALMRLPPDQRGQFVDKYNASHKDHNFDAVMADLSNEDARTLRMTTALARTMKPADVNQMMTQMRASVATQRDQHGWTGVSAYLTDKFGFSGPAVDNALRDAEAAAKDIAGAQAQGERIPPAAIRRLQDSRTRLIRAMTSYTGEQRELADNAVQIATAAIAVASLGTSITASALLRGATLAVQMQAQGSIVAGSTLLTAGAATAPHAAFEGPDYTAERAMYDALIYGGSELVGGGVGAALIARPARTVVPEVVQAVGGR